jgi:hypothetical protein
MAVDPLLGRRPPHLVNRLDHRQQERAGGLTAEAPLEPLGAQREEADAPAAVAAGGAEAGHFPLQHRHPQ